MSLLQYAAARKTTSIVTLSSITVAQDFNFHLKTSNMMDKVELKLSNMSLKDRERVTLHERRTGRKLFLPKPLEKQQVRNKKSF